MATARILLLLFCFVPVYGNWLHDRDLLNPLLETPMMTLHSQEFADEQFQDLTFGAGTAPLADAGTVIGIAEKELGVRELTGKNDGPRVEIYLRYVGLKKGHAWCAAFLSWVYGQAGYALPKSAWSPELFPARRLRKDPAPALVLGIYFPALKRIAHVGLVTELQHDWVHSIEGNTNPEGSREGEGVYRRLRHKRFIYTYANYL
jgi:hypothetical protein